ncbi:hypothetical protein GGQ96_002667 [Sphingomonas abaci]|uniref:Uncharacterized protein n=1 Tax=Sphingomonas abaci TaxID=237611 RepID=A0A7W7ALV2_9SPHN|nr:hypothetical protein [Sphingomonas abaci]
MPWEHHQIVVGTYSAREHGSKSEVRVRPLPGQMCPPDMQVQFSRQARTQPKVGTCFRIWVKETDLKGDISFLQSPWQWPYAVVG